MPCIAVLNGSNRRVARQNYFLSLLAEEWAVRGMTVNQVSAAALPEDTDVAIVHVDLTRVPAPFISAARQATATINADAADISKRVVSERIVGRCEDAHGAVIVKTDANCGGLPERFEAYDRALTGYLHRAWDRWAPWTWTGVIGYGGYPVYPRAVDVPQQVWRNPKFVVEPFTPERRGSEVVVRSWTFLGDREVNRVSVGTGPILKRDTTRTSTWDPDIPDAVRAARTRLGLDYGKIDYVVVDGDPIVLDANRTPTVSRASSDTIRDIARQLAPGIDAFLP